ncbi:hypothetical protein L208DRAFT_837317 [Tricholoma matsutake]|nr:hypothetical protein L208DRAFT_837317 [Tricholoma matsutake 945]
MLPTDDDKDNVLSSCRYGDLDELQDYVKKFGPDSLAEVRDANGNSILHMVCGNGHIDILDYLLPIIPASLLASQNNAKSTPLHWASLNSHLLIAQRLVGFPGPGVDLIDIKNAAGRSPLAEAELVGWEEGSKWLVQMMKLDAEVVGKEGDDEGATSRSLSEDVEVEIEDADGQMAKITISGGETKFA